MKNSNFREKLVLYCLLLTSLSPAIQTSSEGIIFGELINEVILKYFMKYRCITFITENEQDLLYYVPPDIDIFHIRIGDKTKIIEEIEENDTFDANEVSSSTKSFERMLIQTLDANCQGYIIQVKNPRSVVYSFARATRRCVTRHDRSYVFLSFDSHFDAQDIFSLKEMNFMPNLIIAKISRKCEIRELNYMEQTITTKSDLIYIRNQTRRSYTNRALFNLHILENASTNNSSKYHFSDSMSVSINKAINDTCIEIITHKFAGRESSSEKMLLDVWKWNGMGCQFVFENNLFPDKLVNLEGKQMRIISFPWAQFVVSDENSDPPINDGIDILIFKEFSRKFNSTFKLCLDAFNLWGFMYDNGTGTGLQGDIMMDRADFAVAALYMWHSTFQWIDYTQCYYKTAIICMAPKPKMLPKWMSPILPFNVIVWCLVGISILIVATSFYILNKTSRYIPDATGEQHYNTLLNSVLVTIGLFLEQCPSSNSEPENPTQNIFNRLVASILVFSVLLNTAYNSGLSSCLTIPQFEKPTDTIQDFVDRNILWAANHKSWIWSIQETDEPLFHSLVKNFRIWDGNKIAEMASQAKTGFPMEVTPAGNYAIGLTMTKEIIQAQRIMKEILYWSHTAIWARKNSAYIGKLNTLLGNLNSAGILLYWDSATIRKYFSLTVQISVSRSVDLVKEDGPIKLTMEHMEGIFFILVIGLFFSFIVFLNEMLTFWLYKRYFKK